MIVPEFWAEARLRVRTHERQITVRRFGWSDESQAAAQANADERAREAFHRIASGEKLDRREPKVPYNGADGVPIREEILSRHGNAVVTRNLYGARCLNTPNVLFADVDLIKGRPPVFTYLTWLLVIGIGIAVKIALSTEKSDQFITTALVVIFYCIAQGIFWLYERVLGDARQRCRRRIRKVAEAHPGWHLRVYETPAGFRILAMHQTFDPQDETVQRFFKALKTDPTYVRMCRNQRCFRARLTAKPWRLGIAEHMKPRPGVWPVKPEHLPRRQLWIDAYEARSRFYAACQFSEALGRTEMVHPEALAIQGLHDELCRAHSGLPLA